MKLCFPVTTNQGIDSLVFNHFGSAPLFVIANTDTMAVSEINNQDLDHQHGACNPALALAQGVVDAIAVRGIGQGALNRLHQMGLKVYRAEETIGASVQKMREGTLEEWPSSAVCEGHGDHDCSH
jgi:predicted Fe-Mo cluster-binding NifX family protein